MMPTRLMDSDAAADGHVMLPGHDLRRAKFTASRPDAQKRLICMPGTEVAEARAERRRARDIAARLADRIDAAENDVIDQAVGVEIVALLERFQRRVASASAVTSCSAPSDLPRRAACARGRR
jgi:hypothetical protein